MRVVIHNIALPLVLDERFIAPDLMEAIKYYPNFIRASELEWSPQAYLCAILHEIDLVKPNGMDGSEALKLFISHYGLWRFGELMEQKW